MSRSSAAELAPDWSVHPGVLLQQLLEQQGVRQSELAERVGLTPKHLNQIVKGLVGLSPDVALLLERALNSPPRFWASASADYETHLSEQRAATRLPEYASWASSFQAGTLHKYGITKPSDTLAAKVDKLLRFFGVATPDAFERTWIQPRVSFRRSQAFTVAEHNTALWLRLVELAAERATVQAFKPAALRRAVRSLPAMTNLNIADGFMAARAALAEAGVVLTFVPQVPDTRVCGATWWLGADRPVIGLTERNRKPDIFWFTLVHEVGHVLLHPRRTTHLDLDGEKGTKDQAEVEADEFAESVLLPSGAAHLIATAETREQLVLLAARLGIGASIVAGQHGHHTGAWSVGAGLRGKISDSDIADMEQMCPTGL